MADSRVSELDGIAGSSVDVDNDLLPIIDVSAAVATRSKKISAKELVANTPSFVQSGTGASTRTVLGKLRDVISVFDFIPESLHAGIQAATETSDLTIYVQAAVDAAYTANAGTLYFPEGTYYWTTISRAFSDTNKRSVSLIGAGTKSTIFKKHGSGTDPMIQWSTSGASVLELYAAFRDFSIFVSGKTFDGIKLTDCAYLQMERLNIEGCDKAVHGLGFLVSSFKGCTFRSNAIGIYLRKNAGGTIRPNAIYIGDGCVISGNTSFGVDYGDGAMLSILQSDMETNGSTGNTGTGAIMIRNTTDDDASVAFSQVTIQDVWFENNDGRTLQTESSTNLILSLNNCKFIGDEEAANIGSGRTSIDNVVCAAGTFTIAGNSSTIRNSTINVITDTSTQQIRENVFTSTFSGGMKIPVIATASIPAAGAGQDGRILIEDAGAGNRNIIIYAGGERFRIDGGAAV